MPERQSILTRSVLFVHQCERIEHVGQWLGNGDGGFAGDGQDVVGDLTSSPMLVEQCLDLRGGGVTKGFLALAARAHLAVCAAPAAAGPLAGFTA